MRRLRDLLAGMVMATPLKVTELEDCSSPGTPAGAGPAPVAIVSETSVALVAEIRLVTATLRKIARFSVIVEPGSPPVQVSRISPRVSARPSARTGGFTAPVAQVKGVGWDWAMP